MKGVIIFLLSIFLFSCGDKEKVVRVPPDIIPEEKMSRILIDIHIAEAAVKLKTDSSFAETGFQRVFSKHSVTREQYEKSLNYYMDNPAKLNEIYEGVLNEISRMQGEESKPEQVTHPVVSSH